MLQPEISVGTTSAIETYRLQNCPHLKYGILVRCEGLALIAYSVGAKTDRIEIIRKSQNVRGAHCALRSPPLLSIYTAVDMWRVARHPIFHVL